MRSLERLGPELSENAMLRTENVSCVVKAVQADARAGYKESRQL